MGQMCASLKTGFCITGCHLFSLKKHVFTALFCACRSSHALEARSDFCVNGHLGTPSPELFDCQMLQLSPLESLFFNKINLFYSKMPRAIIHIIKLRVTGGHLKIAHSKSSDTDTEREIIFLSLTHIRHRYLTWKTPNRWIRESHTVFSCMYYNIVICVQLINHKKLLGQILPSYYHAEPEWEDLTQENYY